MRRNNTNFIRLYNKSRQMLPISAKAPKGDFFIHESTIQLQPGRSVTLPRSHVNMDQIQNLRARTFLKIVHDDGE